MDQASEKRLAWGPIRAILGTVLLFFGSQLVVAIGISVVLILAGWDQDRIEAWFSGGNTSQFIINTLISAVTLGLLFQYLSLLKAKPKDLGLVKPRLRDIGYVLLGAGMYIIGYQVIVSTVADLVSSLNTEQLQDLGFNTDTTGLQLSLIFVSLVVLPPIVEEIVVRGFLFTGLRSKLNFWAAAVIASGLFGLAHLLGGEGGSTIWIATIDTFILGLVLSYLREKTGSLWAPIGLHALKNFIAFMALFVFS